MFLFLVFAASASVVIKSGFFYSFPVQAICSAWPTCKFLLTKKSKINSETDRRELCLFLLLFVVLRLVHPGGFKTI